MPMRRYPWSLILRLSRWLAVALLVTGGALMFAAPALAAAYRPRQPLTGDSMTLSVSSGTFVYGGDSTPTFTVAVTFSAMPPSNGVRPLIILDTGDSFSSVNFGSLNGLTETFSGIKDPYPIPAGNHTANATYYDGNTGTTLTSNTVNFTIGKAHLYMACQLGTVNQTIVGAGKTIQVGMEAYDLGILPDEWHTGTFSVTFNGPTHVSYPNLTADSGFNVTVTTPTQIGQYTLSCAFNGSANYQPDIFTGTHSFIVSALHSLGSANLFSNPTTLTANAHMTFYIVLHAASGLPAPTGSYQIYMGNYYTQSIPLGTNGESTIQVTAPPSLLEVSKITINYNGDKNYAPVLLDFPLTNPSISGGSGGGSGSGGSGSGNQPSSTAVGNATATGTTSATATAPTGSTAQGASTPLSSVGGVAPQNGSSPSPLLLVAIPLAAVLVVGLGAGFLFWRRRKALAANRFGGQQGWNPAGPDDTYPNPPNTYPSPPADGPS